MGRSPLGPGGYSPFVRSESLLAESYAGTEMVGVTAGEAGNLRQAVPHAIFQVLCRILILCVGMIFFTGVLIPWNDKRLLSKGSKTAHSPLTIALSGG